MENVDIFQLLASIALVDRRSSSSSSVAAITGLNMETCVNSSSKPLTRTIHGAEVGAGSLTPLIGFYFGASWCPPCRAFSPILSDFAKCNAPDFSVIFVSVDHSAKESEEFLKGKSFLSIPYESSVRQALLQRFAIRMFPTLVICDTRTGKVITRWGRMAIQNERSPGTVVAAWLAGSNGVSLLRPVHMVMLVVITLSVFWYWGLLF